MSQFSTDPDPRFDSTLNLVDAGDPSNPFDDLLQWNGLDFDPGDLAIEMNPGNENHWIKVRVRGTVDVLATAKTPRDGIGAIITVVPCDEDEDSEDEDSEDEDSEDEDKTRK